MAISRALTLVAAGLLATWSFPASAEESHAGLLLGVGTEAAGADLAQEVALGNFVSVAPYWSIRGLGSLWLQGEGTVFNSQHAKYALGVGTGILLDNGLRLGTFVDFHGIGEDDERHRSTLFLGDVGKVWHVPESPVAFGIDLLAGRSFGRRDTAAGALKFAIEFHID